MNVAESGVGPQIRPETRTHSYIVQNYCGAGGKKKKLKIYFPSSRCRAHVKNVNEQAIKKKKEKKKTRKF